MSDPPRGLAERLAARAAALAHARDRHPASRPDSSLDLNPATVSVHANPDPATEIVLDGFRTRHDAVCAAAWVIRNWSDVVVVVDDPTLFMAERTRIERRIELDAFHLARTDNLC